MKKPATVAEYLKAVPQPARGTLQKVRAAILAVSPKDSVEVINYGIPAVKHKKIIAWYAAFADHCSLFPTSAVIAEFKDELQRYKVSKGTIQFPLNRPLPAALIKKMVKVRITQIESKKGR